MKKEKINPIQITSFEHPQKLWQFKRIKHEDSFRYAIRILDQYYVMDVLEIKTGTSNILQSLLESSIANPVPFEEFMESFNRLVKKASPKIKQMQDQVVYWEYCVILGTRPLEKIKLLKKEWFEAELNKRKEQWILNTQEQDSPEHMFRIEKEFIEEELYFVEQWDLSHDGPDYAPYGHNGKQIFPGEQLNIGIYWQFLDEQIQKLTGNILKEDTAHIKKEFCNYLTHPESEKLAFQIRTGFKGAKSKAVKLLILVLDKKELLSIMQREMKAFIESMEDYFGWDVGSYEGIMAFKYEESMHKKDYDAVELKIDAILKGL